MIIKCKFCWIEFVKKTYNQIICWSIQCKKESKKISYIQDYERHKERCMLNAKKLRYILKCVYCSNEFKSYNKSKVVCSDKWYRERMSVNRLWEKNPAYRNWVYTKWWDKVNIHQFKERSFTKICKVMNNEMLEKYWYRFCECCWINQSLRWEHHHIVFRSEKPRHEHLHDRVNIINLCIKCHNEFHKNKSKRDPLMIERWLDKIFWITI